MRKKHLTIIILALIIIGGFFIPQHLTNPVSGATTKDYHPESFWYYPWGKSVTHKGIDIFAQANTSIKSSTKGIVLYTGEIKMGGNIVVILGPKWRIHYYAHLNEISTSTGSFVNHKSIIGSVGNTGNAKGKPAHLHYSITTLVPYIWRVDTDKQGWKKMFYLNPITYFGQNKTS